ncbi:MAG: hypothetical protein ACPG51_15720 [Thiolinea sp.]
MDLFSHWYMLAQHVDTRRLMLDVVFLSSILPVVGYLLNPNDVLFLEQTFPWVAFPPVMLSLRYGWVWGGVSLCIIALYFFLGRLLHLIPASLISAQFAAGTVLLVYLTGELSSRWRQQLQQYKERTKKSLLTATRLDKSLQLLHVSHSRLEESLVDVHQSLANSLRLLEFSQAQQSLGKSQSIENVILKMHEILSGLEWLEVAAFIRVTEGRIDTEKPLAVTGKFTIDWNKFASDQMIMNALQHHKAYMQQDWVSANEASRFLVVIPIVDVNRKIHALLTVQQITPQSFNKQNAGLLLILCQYLGELINNQKALSPVRRNQYLLAHEITSAVQIVRNSVNSVMLVSVEMDKSEHSQEYEAFFVANTRRANRLWYIVKESDATSLLMLFPLFLPDDFVNYQQNLCQVFEKKFHLSPTVAGIRLKDCHLPRTKNKQVLHKKIESIIGKIKNVQVVR